MSSSAAREVDVLTALLSAFVFFPTDHVRYWILKKARAEIAHALPLFVDEGGLSTVLPNNSRRKEVVFAGYSIFGLSAFRFSG